MYLGIDCGMDGGIALVDASGTITRLTVMPTLRLGKGRRLDIDAIDELIVSQKAAGGSVIIEDPGGHAPSAAGLRSLSLAYGAIEALLIVRNVRHHSISARKWQKKYWTRPKMPQSQKYNTKAQALATAKRLWPEQDWTKSARARTPHDGLIDAALIAEYGRLLRL